MAGLLAAPFINVSLPLQLKRRKPSKKSQITDRARADHPSHRHLSTPHRPRAWPRLGERLHITFASDIRA
jgi:hypothetical protein